MTDFKAIHETVIRDIIELTKEIKNVDSVSAILGRQQPSSAKSIASMSAGLTMVFPVLASDSLSIDSATMVAKAIERKATTMLNLVLVAQQTTEAKSVQEYMKQFHNNIRVNDDISVDEMISILDNIALNESGDLTKADIRKLLENDMNNINNSGLEDNVNDKSIGDYQILPGTESNPIIVNTPSVVKESNENKEQIAILSAEQNYANFRIRENLQDNDVKKSNELIPTTLQVKMTHIQPNGTNITTSGLIGIKAKLYKLSSMDIVERLVDKTKNSNAFNKFIRSTTRELSFFKDFLFAIDQARIDALSTSNRGSSSKMWKVLEQRSLKSKFRRRLGMVNDSMAITTLVISQEEVELIKKEFNVDLEKESIMRPILEIYNLMGFVIVDETNEVAKFLFDTGDDLYEHLSFKSLERENNDQSYKRVVNLLSRMG